MKANLQLVCMNGLSESICCHWKELKKSDHILIWKTIKVYRRI